MVRAVEASVCSAPQRRRVRPVHRVGILESALVGLAERAERSDPDPTVKGGR